MSSVVPSATAQPPGERARRPAILAVDDEPTVLAAVARDLRRGFGERYRVLRAPSGAEALELLREVHRRGDQVALDLLDNAIAALGDTGTITLTTRKDGDGVLVTIADDGPGIPADVVDRIFDPFYTTKAVGEGTGLGPDTARRIVVDRHDGTLTVNSVLGHTRFYVWLPLHPTQDLEPDTAPDVPPRSPSHEHRLHAPGPDHRHDPAGVGPRLPGLPGERRCLAAPAHLPVLWPRRLL